jgi:hypothetical protein
MEKAKKELEEEEEHDLRMRRVCYDFDLFRV